MFSGYKLHSEGINEQLAERISFQSVARQLSQKLIDYISRFDEAVKFSPVQVLLLDFICKKCADAFTELRPFDEAARILRVFNLDLLHHINTHVCSQQTTGFTTSDEACGTSEGTFSLYVLQA